MLILLFYISTSTSTSEDTCTKEDSCEGINENENGILKTYLGLPGSDAEWVDTFDNVIFNIQHYINIMFIKMGIKELGLGQVLGEIAQRIGLPGTRDVWTKMFKDVTMDTIVDTWNEFLFNISNGNYYN